MSLPVQNLHDVRGWVWKPSCGRWVSNQGLPRFGPNPEGKLAPMTRLYQAATSMDEAQAVLRDASRLERLLSASDQFLSEPPVPGSRMYRAEEQDLRDGYDLARACIVSAEDHLRTSLAILKPAPPLIEVTLPQFSLYTLLRAACMADVRARHLLDLGITETRRLACALNERLDNLKEQRKALPESKLFDERVSRLEQRARSNGIDPHREKGSATGPISHFDEPWSSDFELFSTYLPAGSLAFRFLSGQAHSKPWVQIRRERAEASDDPRVALVPTDLDVLLYCNILESELDLHDEVVGAWMTLAGYPAEVWAGAKEGSAERS